MTNIIKPLNVLSLFDGISCGQIALNKLGIPIENYYASEIEKASIDITQHNYPDTIQLGDVTQVDANMFDGPIDLLIGGSPCQSFSMAGKRNGMVANEGREKIELTSLEQYLDLKAKGYDFDGQSYLFWEFARLYTELKPTYYFLENVVMKPTWETIISNFLRTTPALINSNTVSAQNRERLYWTNIAINPLSFGTPCDLNMAYILDEPQCDLVETLALWPDYTKRDIIGEFTKKTPLMDYQDRQTLRFFKKTVDTTSWKKAIDSLRPITKKSKCLTKGGQNISNSGATNIFYRAYNGKLRVRSLNAVECERLQTVPDHYTDAGSSENVRCAALGNGWTVDVVVNIFRGLNRPAASLPSRYNNLFVEKT